MNNIRIEQEEHATICNFFRGEFNFYSLKMFSVTNLFMRAAWCGPCRTIAPVIEELAGEYQGRLRVAKVNVDENPEAPAHFGIRSIPTLMLFKDGELKEQVVGVQPKSQLNGLINRYVQ